MNLKERLAAILAELRAIDEKAGDDRLSAEGQERFDALLAERAEVEAAIVVEERTAAQRAEIRALADAGRQGAPTVERSTPNVIVRTDPFAVLEDRSAPSAARSRALVDGLLRANDGKIEDGDNQAHFEAMIKRHSRGDAGSRWAENLLARSRDEYTDGFAKLMTGREAFLTSEERAALAIGTATQGGALVPTHLDPTIILTNAGSDNPLRAVSSVRTLLEGNVWNGVTSAGVTASVDAELAEVSDDSPSVAAASITLGKGAAFVQASVEAFQDINGLASDVLMMFADARDRLEGTSFATGTGGLFTLINASASLKTTSTTAATIGEVDIHALYRALPIRWRKRGTFVANPLYTLAVKRLGTAVSSSFSGDLTQPVSDRWLGRPALEVEDAPTTQTTTALDQEIVFADLSQFIIVDKPGGFSVDFIPHLFATANNLPSGTRGWYGYWRFGSGMPALAAGRILVDKTSA